MARQCRRILALLVFSLGLSTATLFAPGTVHAWAPHVAIQYYRFHPGVMVVPPGGAVTWTNWDPYAHTSSSDSGMWDSGALRPGMSFGHAFTAAGTYWYHCNIHPFMHGVVLVGSGAFSSRPAMYAQPGGGMIGRTALFYGLGFHPNARVFVLWQRPDGTRNGIWVFSDSLGIVVVHLGFQPMHRTGTESITAFDAVSRMWAPWISFPVTA